jgi:hypothetical protein
VDSQLHPKILDSGRTHSFAVLSTKTIMLEMSVVDSTMKATLIRSYVMLLQN